PEQRGVDKRFLTLDGEGGFGETGERALEGLRGEVGNLARQMHLDLGEGAVRRLVALALSAEHGLDKGEDESLVEGRERAAFELRRMENRANRAFAGPERVEEAGG